MEYVYICQTHGYFCKEYKKKPKVEVACPKCNKKCRVVQEKKALQEELNEISKGL